MVKIIDTKFSDIYITPDKKTFIPNRDTAYGLSMVRFEDFETFFELVEKSWDGHNPSYSLKYGPTLYRVEKSDAVDGVQYCARKMPEKVPMFSTLGFRPELTQYLMSLGKYSGLILCSGSTGAGKTTTVSSLLKEFLDEEGGFAYTIEDPAEMPLDGVYQARSGALGLCKQTTPPQGNWGNGLKSALRSNPRFILVGEIRTPETASEVLRAATSGHLVLSTIHANNVTDAITSVVKYASAESMSEDLAYDLFSRGMLAVLHQRLMGVGTRTPVASHVFANPNTSRGDQVRGMIKTGKLNLGTVIDTQATRLTKGMPLFQDL